MNWADQIIFDHFNATLWKRISQYPDFEQEMEEFQCVAAEPGGVSFPHLDYLFRKSLFKHADTCCSA